MSDQPAEQPSIADLIGKAIHDRAAQFIAYRQQTYGDPRAEMFIKAKAGRLVLDAAGVSRGQPFTPRVHAAMKLVELGVGLLKAQEPSEVLAEAMATLSTLAAIEGVEAEAKAHTEAARGARSGTGEPGHDINENTDPAKTPEELVAHLAEVQARAAASGGQTDGQQGTA